MNAHKQCLMAAAQMISQGGSIQLPDMHSTTHNPAQKSMPKDLLISALVHVVLSSLLSYFVNVLLKTTEQGSGCFYCPTSLSIVYAEATLLSTGFLKKPPPPALNQLPILGSTLKPGTTYSGSSPSLSTACRHILNMSNLAKVYQTCTKASCQFCTVCPQT
eukprot:1145582-Pelagomonas_calceolata.AAC.5